MPSEQAKATLCALILQALFLSVVGCSDQLESAEDGEMPVRTKTASDQQGGEPTKPEVHLFQLQMEKVYVSQGKLKAYEAETVRDKALEQWMTSHTAAQQAALHESQKRLVALKKDEFETTSDFENRQRITKDAIAEAQRLLKVAEAEARKSFPDGKAVDMDDEFRVCLDVHPAYDADKREFSCTITSSNFSQQRKNQLGAVGLEYDEEQVQVTVPAGIPRKLILKNIPNSEFAKSVKLNLKGLRIRGNIAVSRSKTTRSSSVLDAIKLGGAFEKWNTTSYEIRFREGCQYELVGLPTKLELDGVTTEIIYDK